MVIPLKKGMTTNMSLAVYYIGASVCTYVCEPTHGGEGGVGMVYLLYIQVHTYSVFAPISGKEGTHFIKRNKLKGKRVV